MDFDEIVEKIARVLLLVITASVSAFGIIAVIWMIKAVL